MRRGPLFRAAFVPGVQFSNAKRVHCLGARPSVSIGGRGENDSRRAQNPGGQVMSEPEATNMRRRELLALIGTAAGGAVMYRAMSSIGLAAESTYTGPIKLEGDPKGASVLILGAGLAGMVAAFELRRAGYRVQV